ncbi:SOS response-associated peptidase [Anaerocolumna aminovalerica]|jgi:putative SOS response-associated peptidase YedK|uniref:SOS response-associated peptidase n=1 Tax=Anaerocolumna aminovalerica TaxID=1527 RepID=UPI001C0F0B05|nr:SOS response-associated peptidase [Anaerocolumna aminovalerica]MBU5331866.1 SOS response-associated peptidase [Anaerocolumna aminovalerica]
MCGRYYIDDETSKEIEKILQNIDKKNSGKSYKTGEIFPTETVPILVAQKEDMVPDLLTWGFPNSKSKGVIINARSETAFDKNMFQESLISRRCIIPANGFYEWNKNKEKIYFTQPDSDIIYMAGVYNVFNEESRFVILTTNANDSILDVHDRMPLILQREELHSWLFDNNRTQDFLKQVPTILERKSEYQQITLEF